MKPIDLCCPECIGDNYIRDALSPFLSNETGTCDYCESENVPLIEPKALRDKFESLLSIYIPSDNGKSLAQLLKEDWQLFSHSKMDLANTKVLLADILDDGEIVRKHFSISNHCQSNAVNIWDELRAELMYKNRYFPQNSLPHQDLNEILSYFVLDDKDYIYDWHRARVNEGTKIYEPQDLSAPPKEKASSGRANPTGIPYLYLASDIDTAIAEIRPHAGNRVSSARFSIPLGLKIIDLRFPRKTASPFRADDEGKLEKLRMHVDLFVQLGFELSQPIAPQHASYHYIPTQYLCELFKNKTFDGVMYKSSIGNGTNIAIFYPEKAQIHEITQHQVNQIFVEHALA